MLLFVGFSEESPYRNPPFGPLTPGSYTAGLIGLRLASMIDLWDSNHSGRERESPRRSLASSTMKPGGTVAISSRRPFGSLKYMDLKYFRSRTCVTSIPEDS